MFINEKNGRKSEYISKEELEKTYKYQTKLFDAKIEMQQSKINELINFISERFGEDSLKTNIDQKVKKIEENFVEMERKSKENVEEILSILKKEIENQNRQFVNEIDNLSDVQTKAYNKYYNYLENNENKITDIDKKITEKFINIDKTLKDNNIEIKNSIKDYKNKVNGIENSINKEINDIKQNLADISLKVDGSIDSNNDASNDITKLYKYFQKTEENINNINKKTEELDNSFKEDNNKIQIEIGNLLDDKIKQINKTMEINNSDVNLAMEENKIKNEQNIEILSETIESAKHDLNNSISNIKDELLKLQQVTNGLKSKQEDKTDLEDLKRNYNQYVKKVDGTVEKLTKTIIGMQEQNKEASKNLQFKIKTYIDSKTVSTINGLEDTINKVNLSIIEKEKLQKLEWEETFNKKLKEIQKENERTINKKINEIMNQIKSDFNNYKNQNIEIIENYKNTLNLSKKIFEPIDNSDFLKQTASNNIKHELPKEKKNQVLKFFYDDDDIN